jgi:hypothetical protein
MCHGFPISIRSLWNQHKARWNRCGWAVLSMAQSTMSWPPANLVCPMSSLVPCPTPSPPSAREEGSLEELTWGSVWWLLSGELVRAGGLALWSCVFFYIRIKLGSWMWKAYGKWDWSCRWMGRLIFSVNQDWYFSDNQERIFSVNQEVMLLLIKKGHFLLIKKGHFLLIEKWYFLLIKKCALFNCVIVSSWLLNIQLACYFCHFSLLGLASPLLSWRGVCECNSESHHILSALPLPCRR